jgi:four helix bundle protein
VLGFVNILPKSPINTEIIEQLIRSSTSIGANYIGASEFLGKRDFGLRLKISRKEAKGTIYWLRLVETGSKETTQRDTLINE